VNSRAVSTSGSITRCSEREVAMLSSSSDFSKKISKQSTLDSFDTDLLLNYSSCQPFWTPNRLLTAINKKKPKHGRHCARDLFKTFFLFINSLLQQC
jgi:hypothetical protein